jgi:hypothetical protein
VLPPPCSFFFFFFFAAVIRISGTLGKSVEVMNAMKQLMGSPVEVQSMLREMGDEMLKAGVLQEDISKAMSDSLPVETDEMEEVVDQVMWEVTRGSMGTAPPTGLGVRTGGVAEASSAAAASSSGAGRVAVGADDGDGAP